VEGLVEVVKEGYGGYPTSGTEPASMMEEHGRTKASGIGR